MKIRTRGFGFIVAVLLVVGCGAPYATVQKNGLSYRDYAVEVRSISEHKPRFIDGEWNLDNWLEHTVDGTWHRKNIDGYKGPVYVDIYANGSPKRVKKYFSELVLDHDGSISTLTVDITTASTKQWDMKIEDMYKTFIQNMASREPWNTGKRFEKSAINEHAKIIPKNFKVIKVLDYDALIGYVDRQVFDSTEKNANMSYAIFILKFTDITTLNRTENLKGTKEKIPVILTVVLESEPVEFNALVDDFYELIRQIKIKQKDIDVDYVSTSDRPNSGCGEAGKSCKEPGASDDGEE